MRVKKLFILIAWILPLFSIAQRELTGIGQWQYHTPLNRGVALADAGSTIYFASQFGLFSYEKGSGELTIFSKATGLSDVEIADIAYDNSLQLLLIGYQNGNLDILQNNSITNFNDILRKQIVGEKSINSIYMHENMAFISTSFGVVVFDLIKKEVKETYASFGADGESAQVYQTQITGDEIYLATGLGVLRADWSNAVNLLDFNNWEMIHTATASNIAYQDDNLYILLEDTSLVVRYNSTKWDTLSDLNGTNFISATTNKLYFISPDFVKYLSDNTWSELSGFPEQLFAVYDDSDTYWLVHETRGLGQYTNGNVVYLTPTGPSNSSIFSVHYSSGIMHVTQGGYSNVSAKLFRTFAVDLLNYDSWITKGFWQDTALRGVTDVVNAITLENGDRYYATHSKGIVKEQNEVFTVYDDSISPLQSVGGEGMTRAPAMDIDLEGNIWVGNHGLPLGQNSIYKVSSSGDWTGFSFPDVAGSRFPLKIFIDENNWKWITLGAASTGDGVLVFDDANDQYRWLRKGFENGDLQDSKVNDIAFDKEGAVWMVGRAGVSVFQNPITIFDGGEINDASKPIFEGRPLMENEYCTSIAIDGGNRKWIGTENGLFLMNEAGTEQLEVFNKDNSPLPTNKINDLELHPETGELFIATDKGLVTYRTNSSQGQASCKGLIKVFPNPVTPDFSGEVGISVLTDDAEIKITDAWGNLVYETEANGGTGAWDTRDYTGNEAASGVYTILVTARGRKKSCAENLAIMR